MDLKDKQKIVQVIGAADEALTKLEESIHAAEAQGKTPPKTDTQLLKSIHRVLDLLKSKPFIGEPVPHDLWPEGMTTFPTCLGWNYRNSGDYYTT